MIKIENKNVTSFINEIDYDSAFKALDTVKNATGAGAEYTGWVKLPENYDKEEYICD